MKLNNRMPIFTDFYIKYKDKVKNCTWYSKNFIYDNKKLIFKI